MNILNATRHSVRPPKSDASNTSLSNDWRRENFFEVLIRY
jgi:hypothetical protein